MEGGKEITRQIFLVAVVAPKGLKFLFDKRSTGDVEGGALTAFVLRTVCVQFDQQDVGSFLFVHGDRMSCRFR